MPALTEEELLATIRTIVQEEIAKALSDPTRMTEHAQAVRKIIDSTED